MASGVRMKAGMSAGRDCAARRLIMVWPLLPQPKEEGTARSARRRRKSGCLVFILGEYKGSEVASQRPQEYSRGDGQNGSAALFQTPTGKGLGLVSSKLAPVRQRSKRPCRSESRPVYQ